LAKKLIKAGHAYGAKTLWISGGVSANDRLFEYANGLLKEKRIKDTRILADRILTPIKKVYSTDNAAMIGVAWLLQSTDIA
jgi:tRNA A37 threonylcarbamoyltransferase TsaD